VKKKKEIRRGSRRNGRAPVRDEIEAPWRRVSPDRALRGLHSRRPSKNENEETAINNARTNANDYVLLFVFHGDVFKGIIRCSTFSVPN